MSIESLRKKYQWPMEKPNVPPKYSKGNTPEGWCHGNNVNMFKTLVNENTKVIIDAGSWLGLSAWHFLNLAPNATVICLDTWQGSVEHKKNAILPVLYETFLVNMWQYKNRIIPVKADGSNGLAELYDHSIKPDLVYIDMAHDKGSVIRDIYNAWTRFPDAQICGDDYTWTGVKEALEFLMNTGKMSFTTYETCWKINK